MSKSKGNVVAPQKVSSTHGAEILRLWVGATDYSGELSISDEILKRVVESYRRIRNTLRFLLANTADFDAAKDTVPPRELFELDRHALAVAHSYFAEFAAAYERFEFHPIVQQLQTFCSEELGGFYLDVLKDRLYTDAANSRRRRSADRRVDPRRNARYGPSELHRGGGMAHHPSGGCTYRTPGARKSRPGLLPSSGGGHHPVVPAECSRNRRSARGRRDRIVAPGGSRHRAPRYEALASLGTIFDRTITSAARSRREPSEAGVTWSVHRGRCWHYRADAGTTRCTRPRRCVANPRRQRVSRDARATLAWLSPRGGGRGSD
jgi:hypothetical protein